MNRFYERLCDNRRDVRAYVSSAIGAPHHRH
jgi:hypothetical protein